VEHARFAEKFQKLNKFSGTCPAVCFVFFTVNHIRLHYSLPFILKGVLIRTTNVKGEVLVFHELLELAEQGFSQLGV